MMTRTHPVRFLTPAFLGNAEQRGQWRTPPFKAQLRQWWRVAYAADCGYRVDLQAMRREEGLLFGNAWLSHHENGREVADHRKSLLRLRLDRWEDGTLAKEQWPRLAAISHPEVRMAVASDLYMAYGPVSLPRGAHQPTLKANAAIQAGESATLSFAVPTTHKNAELRHLLENNGPRIERSLWLMDRYGTVGGRSRNGWGSYSLLPFPPGESQGEGRELAGQPPLRPWHDCLQLDWDWPHAIGKDEQGPLIWETAPHGDWKSLMKTLAIIKIGLRTQFVFPNSAPPHDQPLPRHWLSYPITRHATKGFDRNARLPNQLRFKVRATAEGRLIGVILHVPHLPPAAFRPNLQDIEKTWESVHRLLDELTRPASRGYTSITDSARRAQLKPQLDSIAGLRRTPE